MSTVNAPQPDASGPAEVFDSTIAAPSGNISRIGLPGPNNAEAPMHTGAANGIDPFFHTQYIALATFTWSTISDPGSLLWSIPIHPTETHQWLAHLAKMYNAWAGGIDFALKIAGTGFHAGAIMVARIPPNIKPSALTSTTAVTAFEYTIMDPKMLEVEIKSVMDQRNVMYHYLPLDIENRQTFGGFVAVYVLLPLSTSSTGATEISIQVLARPSQNFTFTQIRPINLDTIPIVVPTDLENALDFRNERTALREYMGLDNINIWSAKTKPFLEPETVNAIGFDQEPMNGYLIPRISTQQEIAYPEDVSSEYVGFTADASENQYYLAIKEGPPVIAWTKTITHIKDNITYPIITGSGRLTLLFSKSKLKVEVTFFGAFAPVNAASDPERIRNLKQKFTIDKILWGDEKIVFQKSEWGELKYDIFPDNNTLVTKFYLSIDEVTSYGFDERRFAPPIPESLVTFDDSVYPFEFRNILAQNSYKGFMDKNDALIFELIDTKVDLPILPLKLHYAGYFSTVTHTTDLAFPLKPARYMVKYLNRSKASTPMVSGKQLVQYARNRAVSLFSF